MARRKKDVDDSDGERSVPVLDVGPERPDAKLEELRRVQESLANPDTILERDGVFFAFDPKRYFHEDGSRKTLREDARPPSVVYERFSEKIVFDPRLMAVPIGSGNDMAKLAMEDRLWNQAAGNTIVSLGSVNLTAAQKQAVGLYWAHPLLKNAIKNLSMLTMGEGVTVNWIGSDPKRRSGSGLREKWARYESESHIQDLLRNVVRTAYVCGECFVLRRPIPGGYAFDLIEPDRVDRIFYDTTSARKVAGYRLQQGYGLPPIHVSADSMWHLKFDELGNIPRGIPRALPVFVLLRYWQLFVENRHWLNMVRARIPLIGTMTGSSAQITAFKNTISTLPGPGTVQFMPANMKFEFPTHNIGASDAADDRKMIEAGIAAGLSMPIMLVTGDLSANYSSGVLQESPLVRDIEDARDMIRPMIEWIVGSVMNKPNGDGFSVQFAPVVRRNFADVAAAAGALVDREIWSRRTAAEVTGKSWADIDGEHERIMAEKADGFVNDPPVDPFQKQSDGGVGAPTTGTSQGGSSNTKAAGGDGEG